MSWHYDDNCALVTHKPGDRHLGVCSLDLEWTGSFWVPVCAYCDVLMDGRDRDGWLCCRQCGAKAADGRP